MRINTIDKDVIPYIVSASRNTVPFLYLETLIYSSRTSVFQKAICLISIFSLWKLLGFHGDTSPCSNFIVGLTIQSQSHVGECYPVCWGVYVIFLLRCYRPKCPITQSQPNILCFLPKTQCSLVNFFRCELVTRSIPWLHSHSIILIAALAFLTRFTGTKLWSILCFVTHQMDTASHPRDRMYHLFAC